MKKKNVFSRDLNQLSRGWEVVALHVYCRGIGVGVVGWEEAMVFALNFSDERVPKHKDAPTYTNSRVFFNT